MGQLITSELRKITTTSLWWSLMIPTVLVTFGWALVGGLLGTAFLDLFGQEVFRELETMLGLDTSKWVLNYFVFARSINIGTIFPLIFGGLAIAGESSNKTLTTTFLTAPNRLYALTAKAIVYVIWGAIFGAVISASASVGLLISGIKSDFAYMPGVGGWFTMVGVGILASIMLTLFGVGVGALIRNVAGTIVALVLYFLMIENLIQLFIGGQAPWLIGFLDRKSVV